MRFIVRKRRQTPAVIIIALIDVLIVMLIFLMATTTFRQHPSLRLALPESSQAKSDGASENAPLVLSVDIAGDFRLGADSRPISANDLLTKLEIEVLTGDADDLTAVGSEIAAMFDLAQAGPSKYILGMEMVG